MPNAPLRIGLLGGSFNPAHEGHLHVSREALRRLKLDAVWWLVSPQNPLKSVNGMASYDERFASARAMTAQDPAITISGFEHRHGLNYTYATIQKLLQLYPKVQFVWLMGADNLAGFHRWRNWRDIISKVAVAVFDRSPFSHSALHAKAALALKSCRVPQNAIASLASHPGRWAYILMRRHPASSTDLRKKKG